MIDRCFAGLLGLLVCAFLLGCGPGANGTNESKNGSADPAPGHAEHGHAEHGHAEHDHAAP